MRKARYLPILLVLVLLAGCAKHAVQAPIPNQINTFDGWAYRTLYDAQAAINSFKADVASGKVAETPTIKAIVNQMITDYNAANMAYQAWHAAGGAGATQPVTDAINKVNTDIAAAAGGLK